MIACTQILRTSGLWYSAEYSTFSISDEVGQYRLTVAGYSGDAGDALAAAENPNKISNGMMFSTLDIDNDTHVGKHHAAYYGRGWWDRRGTFSCLNRFDEGRWRIGNFTDNDVQTSRMLVKLI